MNADVHFELFARRDGRWMLEACFADEEEARARSGSLARRTDVQDVRLIREVHLRGMDAPIVTALLDTSEAALSPRQGAEPAPSPALRDGERRTGNRHRNSCTRSTVADRHGRTAAPARSRAAVGVVAVVVVLAAFALGFVLSLAG